MQSLEQEFNQRVRHDFRKYVMLTCSHIHLNEDWILHHVYHIAGYKCHKTVKYGHYTSHIIVKFEDMYYAMEAVARLNFWNWGLKAVLVDDMLRDWFTYEMKTYRGTPYSLTVVDVIGSPPHNLNFLTSSILNAIFQDFGSTYFMPYTAALNEPHVQVLFASMTEALAACIAFGEWYHLKYKKDNFSHRVRINPSNKEECLIKKCGGTPSEAFKLDYFIRLKKECKSQIGKDSATKEAESKSGVSSARVQKLHKGHPPAQSSDRKQINPCCYGTPILYFPIIATNISKGQASKSQHGADFTTALLNLQQTLTTQAVIAISDPEAEKMSKLREHKYEKKSDRAGIKNWKNSAKTLQNNSNRLPHSHLSTWTNVQGIHRRATRIFERSRSTDV